MSPFNACKVFCEYSWPDCGIEFDKFVKKTEYITSIDRKYWNRHGLVGPLHSILGMKLLWRYLMNFRVYVCVSEPRSCSVRLVRGANVMFSGWKHTLGTENYETVKIEEEILTFMHVWNNVVSTLAYLWFIHNQVQASDEVEAYLGNGVIARSC